MPNKGWTNDGGGGVHASSTDRQSGRGSMDAETVFLKGSRIADPGDDNDPLDGFDDLFEPTGQLSESQGGYNGSS